MRAGEKMFGLTLRSSQIAKIVPARPAIAKPRPSAVTSAITRTRGTVTSRRARFCAAVIVDERPVSPKPSTHAAHTRLVQSSGSASDASCRRCVASGLLKRSQISGARKKSAMAAMELSARPAIRAAWALPRAARSSPAEAPSDT